MDLAQLKKDVTQAMYEKNMTLLNKSELAGKNLREAAFKSIHGENTKSLQSVAMKANGELVDHIKLTGKFLEMWDDVMVVGETNG